MRSVNIPPLSPNMTIMTRAVYKASRRLIRDFGELEYLQVSRKGPKDFVTNADLACEKILIEELKYARPDYGFLTEESGEIKGQDPSYRWVIDPIDGTMNFLHGFPFWCISLALEKHGDVIAGVVFDPVRNDLFWAEKGTGAFLNDRRIRVNSRKNVEDSLIVVDIVEQDLYEHIKKNASAVRKTGSAALNLVYVACGRFDAYVLSHPINYWDIAAGGLIVREAGGSVSDIAGRPLTQKPETMLAGNLDLRERLVSLF